MVELYSCVFLKRLKNWEIRERKKSRDYSKETERDDERRREMVRECISHMLLLPFDNLQLQIC